VFYGDNLLKKFNKMNTLKILFNKNPSPSLLNIIKLPKRWASTREDLQKYRSALFTEELKRQKDSVGRIEKIEVRYLGVPEDTTLFMNKSLSTPYNCAQHLSDVLRKRSVVALVNSTIPWDMHKPLEEDCTIQLLNFTMKEPHLANKTFWRSCSFLLGAVLTNCLVDTIDLQLHSFPSPNIKSGSFLYDISLNHDNWKPTKEELRAVSAEMIKLSGRDLPIERLEVNHDLALEIFKDSPYKREQLPSISRHGTVTLYRVGDHVDISRGPMMASTGLLGRCTISAVHRICDPIAGATFYRVQGVALPNGIIINHFAYRLLEDRSKKLNQARLPTEPYEEYKSFEQHLS